MRLHHDAILTDRALAPLEAAVAPVLLGDAAVPVEPLTLWLLIQTYREHHNVPAAKAVVGP